MSPDGNGGIFEAFYSSAIMEKWKNSGVEHIHVYSVDNALVRVADPNFISYCAQRKACCGVKVPYKGIVIILFIRDRSLKR